MKTVHLMELLPVHEGIGLCMLRTAVGVTEAIHCERQGADTLLDRQKVMLKGKVAEMAAPQDSTPPLPLVSPPIYPPHFLKTPAGL